MPGIGLNPSGCCCSAGPTCASCPACPGVGICRNTSCSWGNVKTGGGSSGLNIVSNGCFWDTYCNAGGSTLRITFDMTTSTPLLRVRLYANSTDCGNNVAPIVDCSNLTLVQNQCAPLQMIWSATNANCPGLYSRGYTQFTVTL